MRNPYGFLMINMATPPFLDKTTHCLTLPPFLAKIFRPPPPNTPFPSILTKLNFHPLERGGGFRLC